MAELGPMIVPSWFSHDGLLPPPPCEYGLGLIMVPHESETGPVVTPTPVTAAWMALFDEIRAHLYGVGASDG